MKQMSRAKQQRVLQAIKSNTCPDCGRSLEGADNATKYGLKVTCPCGWMAFKADGDGSWTLFFLDGTVYTNSLAGLKQRHEVN